MDEELNELKIIKKPILLGKIQAISIVIAAPVSLISYFSHGKNQSILIAILLPIILIGAIANTMEGIKYGIIRGRGRPVYFAEKPVTFIFCQMTQFIIICLLSYLTFHLIQDVCVPDHL